MTGFKVVIPSASFSNLKGCVESLYENEPEITKDRILVVDDGAKAAAPAEFPVTWLPGIKPFVFARNVNTAIMRAGGNVFLMNDDARLKTKSGFSALVKTADGIEGCGVVSVAIDGVVGNDNQKPRGDGKVRPEGRVLAFVCVYLPIRTIAEVGLLDERFTAYGGDDMDYSTRVLRAGKKLSVYDGCVVSHGEVPSTFRSRQDIVSLFEEGKRQYSQKYGAEEKLKVDLGTTDDPPDGYDCYVDIVPNEKVPVGKFLQADLTKAWPWKDSSVDIFRANDIIEHLPDKIFTLNEIWRTLKPGGIAYISVPTTDGIGAWSDPTHVSFWNRGTFDHAIQGTPESDRFARSYGIKARFQVVREVRKETVYEYASGKLVMVHLEIILMAVK